MLAGKWRFVMLWLTGICLIFPHLWDDQIIGVVVNNGILGDRLRGILSERTPRSGWRCLPHAAALGCVRC